MSNLSLGGVEVGVTASVEQGELWPGHDEYVRKSEEVEKIVSPILSVLSICLNVPLALYIVCNKELRKFTFLIVAFQVFSSILFSQHPYSNTNILSWPPPQNLKEP